MPGFWKKFFARLRGKKLEDKGKDQTAAAPPPPKSADDAPAVTDTAPAPAPESTTAETTAQEPSFSILPHPAKTNDPADLTRTENGGVALDGPLAVYGTPGPYIPNAELIKNAGDPESREALKARAAELNAPSATEESKPVA